MYQVIATFTDIQDNNHIYFAGDEYPRKGAKPSEKRIKELESTENKLKIRLIKAVDDANEDDHVLDIEQPKKRTKSRKKAD